MMLAPSSPCAPRRVSTAALALGDRQHRQPTARRAAASPVEARPPPRRRWDSSSQVPKPSALAAALSSAVLLTLGSPSFAEPPPAPGVDDSKSDFVQGLLAKSRENKSKNDSDRLYRFYHKDFAINKALGMEVLPEACDPQDPEYGYKCRPKLPRLPEERLDPNATEPGFNGFGGLTSMEPVDDF